MFIINYIIQVHIWHSDLLLTNSCDAWKRATYYSLDQSEYSNGRGASESTIEAENFLFKFTDNEHTCSNVIKSCSTETKEFVLSAQN